MLRQQLRTLAQFVERCPKPRYDTGCTYCQAPEFPPDKQIDFERSLAGTAPAPWKHVLVMSHGQPDFAQMPSKINLVPGSLAADFEAAKRRLTNPRFPVALSNVSVAGAAVDAPAGRHRVRVYPDNVDVQFAPEHLPQFVEHFLLPAEDRAAPHNPFARGAATATGARTRRDHGHLFRPTRATRGLVAICGHAQRDVRCGQLAPLLQREFRAVLRAERLAADVDVALISHIGGHAYAGNVIYFPAASGAPAVWYGRVFPEHVQGIVQETVRHGRIIRELYRGPLER